MTSHHNTFATAAEETLLRTYADILEIPYMWRSVMDIGTPNFDSLMKSGTLTKKDVFRWSIDSNVFMKPESRIRSDFFTFGPSPNSKFYLVGVFSTNASFFSIDLCQILKNDNIEADTNICLKVSFSLLDSRDRCHHTCEREMRDVGAVRASFDRSCYTSHHMTFIHNSKLRILCALDVDEELKEETVSETCKVEVSPAYGNLNQDLISDFCTLLKNGLHSDVTLSVADQDFKVHRSILAARSSVFAAMFEHDTLENQQNRVVIEDISSEAMKELLHFLYTGETDDLMTQELLSLFVAADKYDLPKLKKKCSYSLASHITTETALNVLVVAYLHQEEELKQAAIQGILNNAVEIMKTSKWLTFLQEYPALANIIILNLAMQTHNVK